MATADQQDEAVARVYGSALFDLAQSKDQADTLFEELGDLTAHLERDVDFADFLSTPAVNTAVRGEVIEKLFRGRYGDLLVDSLQVLNNRERLGVLGAVAQAYQRLDEAILDVTCAIINMTMVPGLINVTFSDLRVVLGDGGRSAVGIGVGRGHNRAVEAAQAALQCPLLGDAKIGRATRVLVDFAGDEVTVEEVDALMQVIYGSLNDEALVSFGDTPDPTLRDQVRVTLIAAGIQRTARNSRVPAAGFIA